MNYLGGAGIGQYVAKGQIVAQDTNKPNGQRAGHRHMEAKPRVVEALEATAAPLTCPQGRRTTITFNRRRLEREFRRS